MRRALASAQETVDRTGARVAYEPPGSPAQSVELAAGDEDSASAAADSDTALAITGARSVGLLFAGALVLAMVGGSLTRWTEQRRGRAAVPTT